MKAAVRSRDARSRVPRRYLGLIVRTALLFVAIGGTVVDSYLSVLDFSTLREVSF